MKIKVSEATELQLDWLVTILQGLTPVMRHTHMRAKAEANNYAGDLAWHLEQQSNDPITVSPDGVTSPIPEYSADWGKGGPIVDGLIAAGFGLSMAAFDLGIRFSRSNTPDDGYTVAYGPTVLIAACRCKVIIEMGDEVEIPEDLCEVPDPEQEGDDGSENHDTDDRNRNRDGGA